ncbi:hypothetical protein Csa_022038, partial [Cucumis sativus]
VPFDMTTTKTDIKNGNNGVLKREHSKTLAHPPSFIKHTKTHHFTRDKLSLILK